MAETFVALFEGTIAEISTVKRAIATAITRETVDTLNFNGIGYPTNAWNLFPTKINVTPIPPTPANIPNGIPTTLTINASVITILLSCFFVAPTEERRPNCLVRSATEIEKAL